MKVTKRILSAVMALLMVMGMFSCLGTVAGATYVHNYATDTGSNWSKAFDANETYTIKPYSTLNGTYGSKDFGYIGVEYYELTPDLQAAYKAGTKKLSDIAMNNPDNWVVTDHYVDYDQPLKARFYIKTNMVLSAVKFSYLFDNKFFDINEAYRELGVITGTVGYDSSLDIEANHAYGSSKSGMNNTPALSNYNNDEYTNTYAGQYFNPAHPMYVDKTKDSYMQISCAPFFAADAKHKPINKKTALFSNHDIQDPALCASWDVLTFNLSEGVDTSAVSDEYVTECLVKVRSSTYYNNLTAQTLDTPTVGHCGIEEGLWSIASNFFTFTIDGRVTKSTKDNNFKLISEDANHTFIIGTPGAAAPSVTYAAGAGSFATGFTTTVASVEGKVTLSDGTGVDAPSGKVITGWTDGARTYGLGETIDVIADITLTAVYNAASFTARFFDSDGSTDLELDITGKGEITLPAKQIKSGYRFDGWNDGKTDCAAGSTYILEADTDFTAVFTKVYKATFKYGTKIQTAEFAEGETIEFPNEEFARDGYTLSWTPTDTTMPAGPKTFTAKYEGIKYKVNYFINGNFFDFIEVACGDTIVDIDIPDLGVDKEIKAWPEHDEIMGPHDLDIYAVTTPKQYTVTFKLGEIGNNAVFGTPTAYDFNTVTVLSTFPKDDPHVAGYDFVNWTYEGGGKIYDDDMVVDDITLVANWQIQMHTVNIIRDADEASLENQPYNTEITKAMLDELAEENDFIVDGEKIVWYTDEELKNEADLPYKIKDNDAENINFYADVVNKTYNITFFQKVGSEISKVGEVKDIEFGANIAKTIADTKLPTKLGWKFADWTLENGTAFTATTMPAEDLELYSIGEQSLYTETWIDDLDNGKVFYETTAHYGDAIVHPDVPEHKGYEGLYWKNSKQIHDVEGDIEFHLGYSSGSSNYKITTRLEKLEGGYDVTFEIVTGETDTDVELTGSQIYKPGYVLDNEKSVLSGTITADDKLELVATFNRALVNVTVVDDGKEGDAKTITTQVKYGTPASNPTPAGKTGYKYKGVTWTNSNGTINPPETYKEDVTVTVNYEIKDYNVNVYVDGIKNDKLSKTVTYDTAFTVSKPADKEGYEFDGWYTDPEYTNKYVEANMPADDLDLYGKYDIQSYIVKFVADGETVKEGKFAYGTTIEVPTYTPKEGYVFNGWNNIEETVPAHDITFEAKIQKKTYTVRFYNGEEVVKTVITEFEATPVAPEKDPVKIGHKFAGWSPEVGPITKDVEDEIAYIAQFDIQKYDAVFYKNKGDAQAYDIQNVEFNAKIEKPADPAPASAYDVFAGWKLVDATDVATNDDFVMDAEGKTFVAKWVKDASKCVVQSVERITTPYYGRGVADYKITLAPTYRADKIFIYDGAKTQTYSKGTYNLLKEDSGVKSITVDENDCEIWVVENVLAAATDKYQAYCKPENEEKEELETAMKFDVVYDTKTEEVQKTEIISLDFGGETNIIRGDYRTWTVKTSTDVKWLKFDGTYTTADGTENVASTCYKWDTTSENVQRVDNGDVRTWTIKMRFTYVADDEKVNQNWVLSYRVGNSAEWDVYGAKNVDVVVGRNKGSFIEPTVGYDKYTLVNVEGPGTTVTKGKYANITIITTDDCEKVRVGINNKFSTYQKESTNTLSCEPSETAGLKVWVIKYKFSTAGTSDYTIQTRGTAWGEAKTVTVTVE